MVEDVEVLEGSRGKVLDVIVVKTQSIQGQLATLVLRFRASGGVQLCYHVVAEV